MPAMPALWWLRPVSSACRVAEQIAVVWKRLYLSPPAASFSAAGVAQGPPKALDAPKPQSSISTISTLGAPSGGRNCSIGVLTMSGVLGVVRNEPCRHRVAHREMRAGFVVWSASLPFPFL